jgi:SAM-dependent methyltransferase
VGLDLAEVRGRREQATERSSTDEPAHCERTIGYSREPVDLIERTNGGARRHPWEEARFRFFERLLRRRGLLETAGRVLDVGAGDGWVARGLASSLPPDARIVCWDTGYSDALLDEPDFRSSERVAFARERPRDDFSLVLLLDVIEHVEDDDAFLRTLVDENVVPGGHVLVSVPAWPSLFSSHDVRLRHHRRYTPRGARDVISGAGLALVASGGLFHSLLVPRSVQVARERVARSRAAAGDLGTWNAPALATRAVLAALQIDGAVSRAAAAARVDLPGLSWWGLCRKPSR